MAEGSNRTNRNFAWLRSKKVRGPQRVRVIATMVVSLAVLALSKCVFHSDLRLGEIVLFGTLMGVLAFVLDRSEPEKLVHFHPWFIGLFHPRPSVVFGHRRCIRRE